MKTINVKEKWGPRIADLWKRYKKQVPTPDYKEIIDRGAYVQDFLYTETILFLGIGASCVEETSKYLNVSGDVHYETKAGRDEYPYFKHMKNLAEQLKLADNWSHVDITMLRETAQKKIKPFFKKMPDFMKEQYDIALEMITAVKPRVIIVSNAFVSHLLKKDQNEFKNFVPNDFSSHFDEKIGTDIIETPDALKGTPIFFSCMLSGQAALDIGSRERLFWHIEKVYKK